MEWFPLDSLHPPEKSETKQDRSTHKIQMFGVLSPAAHATSSFRPARAPVQVIHGLPLDEVSMLALAAGTEIKSRAYCGWLRNPCRATLNPWLKPLFVGIYRGIESFQDLFGGAKWISSIHSRCPF